jgi:deazaflavin-dependent oxidoreductase (nitroreductase family)
VGRRGLKLVSSLHVALYRASGGRIGGRLRGNLPVLLLTTTGRKSGKRRTTPLLCVEDDGKYVIIASVGGAPKHPAWYLNLQGDPHATIQIGTQRIAVRAQTATPEERARLWRAAADMYPGYDRYQAKTTREIPVVVLTPSRP